MVQFEPWAISFFGDCGTLSSTTAKGSVDIVNGTSANIRIKC